MSTLWLDAGLSVVIFLAVFVGKDVLCGPDFISDHNL